MSVRLRLYRSFPADACRQYPNVVGPSDRFSAEIDDLPDVIEIF